MRTLLFALFAVLHAQICALSVNSKIHTDSVVLINGKTGRVLWQKDPELAVYPASTTKMATVFYVLMQKSNLKQRVVAQKEALMCVSPFEKRRDNYSKYPSYYNETDGSHTGIKLGEEMSVEDLLYATMLASGNDAANVLAQEVGSGSIDRFMGDLNSFIKKLGCTKTNFCNPHGLHHPEHVTTAKDMARLAQCAMYHPTFCKLAKTQQYERPATNKQPKAFYTQTNRLLRQGNHYYPYAVGIKTGYHQKAQHCLIAAAEKDGRLVICALMRCKERSNIWKDAKALFDAAFNEQLVVKELVQPGNQPFSCEGIHCKTYTKDSLTISYYPSEEPKVRCLLVWDEITLPIEAGQKVGKIQLYADDQEATSVPLYAVERVELPLVAKVERHFKRYYILYLVGLVPLVYLLFGRARRR